MANRQVSALSANAFTSAGFGQVALGEDRERHAGAKCLGGLVHRTPTREQGQRAAPGGGDQGLELVVHRGRNASLFGFGMCIAQ